MEQEMTLHAREIVHAAIHAVDPAQAVQSQFQLNPADSTLQIGENDS
jgi:hypothetical protein